MRVKRHEVLASGGGGRQSRFGLGKSFVSTRICGGFKHGEINLPHLQESWPDL